MNILRRHHVDDRMTMPVVVLHCRFAALLSAKSMLFQRY
jgi:hypothetical protein